MISVPGVGSGLDINSIVSSLVSAEGDAKTVLLTNKRTDTEAEISAFGGLKSIVSSLLSSTTILKTSSTFDANTSTSADTSVYTATTSGSVAAGVYGIEVRDFAEAHKLLTKAYTDQDTVVGTGTLTLSVGTSSFDVVIDSSNNTLAGIRTAINDATDNTGVSATIVNVDDGSGGTESKLILSSDSTGVANALKITVDDADLTDTDSSGLSAFYYDTGDATTPEQLTQINAAIDAEIYIDGQKVLSSSNTVVDAIQGVTLTLLKEDSGNVHDLTIASDTTTIKGNIETFVSNYNSLISYVNNATAFDTETGIAGILLGDSIMRNLSTQIRTQISQSITGLSGNYSSLVDLGITSKSDGSLEINDTKLNSALSTNLDDVEEIFSSSSGIATGLESTLTQYTKTDGIIDNKTSGLNNTVSDINDDIESLALRLEAYETRLLAQFTALDILMSQLNSTSEFLTQQFEQISNISNSS
ncbi:MAG: flagellar filament capping protein FliD [Proteobacteria bacterium]|nr:flagellar cap protein [Pseudomonadota bacterium]NOG58931.1 flagellar filament capping protein FliD [Pseudomonadota bacterium]